MTPLPLTEASPRIRPSTCPVADSPVRDKLPCLTVIRSTDHHPISEMADLAPPEANGAGAVMCQEGIISNPPPNPVERALLFRRR